MRHLLEFLNYHSPRLLKGAQTLPQETTQQVMLTSTQLYKLYRKLCQRKPMVDKLDYGLHSGGNR